MLLPAPSTPLSSNLKLPRSYLRAAADKINKSLALVVILLASQLQLSRPESGARASANNNAANPFRLLLHNQTRPHSILPHLAHLQHQNQNQNHNNNSNPQAGLTNGRPPNSSSFFADIEDLNDSSVRTRTGTHQEPPGPAEEAPSADFDQLMERIVQPLAGHGVFSPQQQALVNGFNGHGSTVAADANNKTTMRFFRNNKTFASIVYTNTAVDPQQQQVGPEQQQHQRTTPARQPRKLINCHLVDLEKHSSDVALFEAKYEIKTVDIEFSEMMQIIEACTNIARFKPLRGSAKGDILSPATAAQLFAASLPASPLNKGAFRPIMVVGRPMPAALPSAVERRREQLQETFQALDRDLATGHLMQSQPADGVQPQERFRRRYVAAAPASPSLRSLEPGKRPSLLTQALARVAEPRHRGQVPAPGAPGRANWPHQVGGSKKLVLGEVTPSADVVANKSGGLKEALQEITSYDTTDLMSIWRGILPGTNWCGMGDRATSYNDLGFESDIDICCRAHDFCPIRLSAFSAGYGLFNWSFYTRSHCRCDQNFLDCLERADSPLSAVVLRFYFTIMKTTCLHDSEKNNAAGRANQQQQEVVKSTSTALSQQTARQRQPPYLETSPNSQQASSQVNLVAPPPPKQQIEPQSNLQRRLLDQLRKSLPIPALRLSQTLRTELDRH